MPSSKKLLAVLGATGNQGYSVASTALSDKELSQRYSVRAIARSTSSPKMADLAAQGASLAAADMDSPETLSPALDGVDTLFFLTTTQYQGNSREIETRQAKAVCEAALAAGRALVAPAGQPGLAGPRGTADEQRLLLLGEDAQHLHQAGHGGAHHGQELVCLWQGPGKRGQAHEEVGRLVHCQIQPGAHLPKW